jgi:predicted metal-binding membrane protein
VTGAMRYRSVALLVGAIVAAWAVLVRVELSGQAPAFHHHTLLNGTRPLWEAIAIFVPAWIVMVVAMMLPSSLGMLATHGRVAAGEVRPLVSRLSFLAAYLLAWTVFGLVALLGDSQVHVLVRASPWLAAHQSLIAGTTLVGAGAFQFTELKRRCLTACRSPLGFILERYRPGARNAFRLGLSHTLFCIGCCWALMLVMFAAGVAALAWMVALSAVMVVEKTTSGGTWLSGPVGLTLIAGGVLTAVLGPLL